MVTVFSILFRFESVYLLQKKVNWDKTNLEYGIREVNNFFDGFNCLFMDLKSNATIQLRQTVLC